MPTAPVAPTTPMRGAAMARSVGKGVASPLYGLEELRRLFGRELGAVELERPVFLGMRLAPLVEPGDAAGDAGLERHRRLPVEQPAGAADVGHVARHLAEQRRRERDVGLLARRLTDQLGDANERVALAVGEVDRLVPHRALGEPLDAADDALDAVVDVGEVEHLVVAAEHRDRLAAQDPVGEERDHPDHPLRGRCRSGRRRSRTGRRCTAAGSSARTSRRAPRRRSSRRSTCSRRRRSRRCPPRSGTGARRRRPRGSS